MDDKELRDDHDTTSMSDLEKNNHPREGDEETSSEPFSNPAGRDYALRGESDKDIEGTLPPQTQNVRDWDGPEDPDNPQNWSTLTKTYHTVVSGLFGFAV